MNQSTTPTPPQEQTEREALLKLARFGAAMLRAHRGISPGEIGDIDGLTAQDEAVKCGVLEAITVTAPCGPSCECVGLFPVECHFVPDAIGRLRRSFEAADKAKGPGSNTEAFEAGQEPPTHDGSVWQDAMPVAAWRAWITDAFQPGGGYWTALLRRPCTDIPTEPLVKRAHAEAVIAALQREVERLQAITCQCVELRADALRFRWLRDRARVTPLGYIELHSNRVPNIACDYLTGARFDAAIDNALASKAEVPNG
jgi:hypothetical protein